MNIDWRSFDNIDYNSEKLNWISAKINSLETQIVENYKLPYWKLMELASFSAWKGTEELKRDLETQLKEHFENNEWININYGELAGKIQELWQLKNSLIIETKIYISKLNDELLRESGDNTLKDPTNFIVARFFSQETLKRCSDPQKLSDHLVWLWVWTLESVTVAWKFTWEVAWWLIKSPYDLYKMASWEEYDWIKKV